MEKCSFCGRESDDVDVLIQNRTGSDVAVYICERCVDVCNAILVDKGISVPMISVPDNNVNAKLLLDKWVWPVSASAVAD